MTGRRMSTREIVASYGDRLRYHYQRNQGLAVARNTGLDLARGDYVTYLDGDDIMCPHNLARKHLVLDGRPELGGVFSDFEVFSDAGTIYQKGIHQTFGFFTRTGKSFEDIFSSVELVRSATGEERFYHGNIFETLFTGNIILPSTMVFRNEFATDVGYFVPELRTQQDDQYWLRFAKRRPFGFLDRVLIRYRRHARQLTDRAHIIRVIETASSIVSGYEQDLLQRGQSAVFNRRKAEILDTWRRRIFTKADIRDARIALAESLRRHPTRLSNGLYFLATL